MSLIRGWPILLVLYYAGRMAPHIRLQKMLFLLASEGRVKLPYAFTKFEHGPYDPDIKIDFLNLDSQQYIAVKKVARGERSYWTFAITRKGREYVEREIIRGFATEDLQRVERVVLKYNTMELKKVVDIVYETYNVERPKLEDMRQEALAELDRLRPIWEGHYAENPCEHVFTTLAFIDYASALLSKKRYESLDITPYNVLIQFATEAVQILKNETVSLAPCAREDCRKIPEIRDIFLYAQYLGEKFRLLPATFSEEAFLEDFECEPVG